MANIINSTIYYWCIFFITEINKYNSFLAPFGLIIQIISVVTLIFLKHKNTLRNQSLFSICGIVYGLFLMFVSDKYVEYQVSKYGQVITAKIIESQIKPRRHTGSSYFAKISYTVNSKEYHQEFSDKGNVYKIGDSIKIKCSIKDPELFKLDQ